MCMCAFNFDFSESRRDISHSALGLVGLDGYGVVYREATHAGSRTLTY